MKKEQIMKHITEMLKKKREDILFDENIKLSEQMSSIEIIEFVAEIEDFYDTFFDDEDIVKFNGTIADIVTFLQTKELNSNG